MASIQLGRVQLKIFRILCRKGRASARELTDALNKSEPIAHSTVQTLLRTLEAKGAVAHDVEGRTFVFYPVVDVDKVRQTATRDLLERMFDGSVSNLVSHLLKSERVSAKELKELRRLINEQERKK